MGTIAYLGDPRRMSAQTFIKKLLAGETDFRKFHQVTVEGAVHLQDFSVLTPVHLGTLCFDDIFKFGTSTIKESWRFGESVFMQGCDADRANFHGSVDFGKSIFVDTFYCNQLVAKGGFNLKDGQFYNGFKCGACEYESIFSLGNSEHGKPIHFGCCHLLSTVDCGTVRVADIRIEDITFGDEILIIANMRPDIAWVLGEHYTKGIVYSLEHAPTRFQTDKTEY